jgi:two-component system, cell cycle response regulator
MAVSNKSEYEFMAGMFTQAALLYCFAFCVSPTPLLGNLSVMSASVLLVGSDRFRSLLANFIQQANLTQSVSQPSTARTVELATDGIEAMQLLQAQQPDLLLIQSSLPDSLTLCCQVKSNPRLAWIYCILLNEAELTAARAADQEANALEMGADAYLTIPSTESQTGASTLASIPFRMLNAQIQAGIRQVETHRDLMRTNDLLAAIALVDPLTDLNNRRALERELPHQIQVARDRHQPISLVIFDVDYFKRINDTYGHLVGDRVLTLVAARLRHNLRFFDTPFRYGGEEFVLLLNETNDQEAEQIAERICGLMRERPFAVDFAIDQTLTLTVTISAGVATLTQTDDANGISLLNRADQRLLAAKSSGRDRVVGGAC